MKNKVALIQLTRIGDILQVFQAARQLKFENPDLELSLIARRSMASGLVFLLREVFDKIFLFDTQDFFPKETKKLSEARELLDTFSRELNEEKFDLLINLSFCKASSYITALTKADIKMGLNRNELNELTITDKWSQYIYSNVLDSKLSPFNLVDLYKFILGAKDNHSFPRKRDQRDTIVVHPFASAKKKSWGNKNWGAFICEILAQHQALNIVIVGAKRDQSDSQAIMDIVAAAGKTARVENMVGRNSLEETFEALCESRYFVGNDSMVGHLAAIAERPGMILSFGSVKPHESAPYNNQNLVLSSRISCYPCKPSTSCEDFACHQDLVPVAVAKLFNQHYNGSLPKEFESSIRCYQTSFDTGGLKLQSFTADQANGSSEVMRSFYRMAFGFYLAELELSSSAPTLNNEAISTLKKMFVPLEYSRELYMHGMSVCKRALKLSGLKTKEFSKVKEELSKLKEIEQLLDQLTKNFPHLRAVENFFKVNRANVSGANFTEVLENNLISFYEAKNFIDILDDLIGRTLGPRIISQSV